jgi:hypothetical protein
MDCADFTNCERKWMDYALLRQGEIERDENAYLDQLNVERAPMNAPKNVPI